MEHTCFACTRGPPSLQDDVPEEVKQRRLSELIAAYRQRLYERSAAEVGRRHLVLVEGPSRRSGAARGSGLIGAARCSVGLLRCPLLLRCPFLVAGQAQQTEWVPCKFPSGPLRWWCHPATASSCSSVPLCTSPLPNTRLLSLHLQSRL